MSGHRRSQRQGRARRRTKTHNKSKATFAGVEGAFAHQCAAKKKHGGDSPVRCKNTAEPGNAVCRMHGSRGGRPPIHGRYSEHMGRLRAAYEDSLANPDILMDLNETLAILDAHVVRCSDRLNESDTPDFRTEALGLFDEARKTTDPDAARDALGRLGKLLRAGGKEDRALVQLVKATEVLAKRKEAAWGIRLNAAQAINARDLVAVLARIAELVIEEAPPDVGAKIIRRLDQEILGAGEIQARISAAGG